MEMNQITVSDADLRKGAEEGMDAFLKVFIDKYLEVTGGKINADTMPLLNGYQHTLLGYHFFREEVMEGGFVQLIQNGYGPYIFDNPFAKAMRMFGAKEFSKLIYEAKKIYDAHRADLEKEQVRIASTVHNREKKLFDEGLTAQSEYEEAKLTFLNKQQNREQLMTSLSSARIQEAQLQQSIIETQMEQSRESNNLNIALQTAYNELLVSINDWELTCLFISPASGILSYNHIWQKNQNVGSGDKVFSIVAKDPGNIIGKIKLPAGGSGKVMAGQRVNISVTGYPYMEFGFLTGKVTIVSLLADEESAYTVTVSLPQDLCTSYGKQLEFKGELTGTAEVMTDERSVTERLLSPLRYLWEKYL